MYIIVDRSGVREAGPGDYLEARLVRLNCPKGLLSDSQVVVDELVDLYKSGYIIIVERIGRPIRDPLRLGLGHTGYEAHYTRPVLVWIAMPSQGRLRLGRLDRPWPIGYKSYSCQASALVVNKFLDSIGLSGVRVV